MSSNPPPSSYPPPPPTTHLFTLPPTLQTPRLTLSLFSPARPSDIAYGTTLFPGLDTLDTFLEFCDRRAPSPWADSAIVYLLRLRPQDDDADAKTDDDNGNDDDDDDDNDNNGSDIKSTVLGHVSLAHSLEDRQPRVLSPSLSSSKPKRKHTPPYASPILRTPTIPDIGWRLRTAHQGHGYATEAVTRFLHFLCEEKMGPGFRVLSVFTGKENERSLGLAGRVGFVCAMGESGGDENDGDGKYSEDDEDDEDDEDGEDGEDGKNGADETKQHTNTSEHGNLKGTLSCPRVMPGMWFGVRPAGWRWEEGRKDRELRRCIEKLFE